MTRRLFAVLCLLFAIDSAAQAIPASNTRSDSELRYVVYLSRHGVRSTTGKPSQYKQYSASAWPEWPVQPGYLTAHGFHLIELFGAYDRDRLAAEGLLSKSGCVDAASITIYADSDQRTRETGKALAGGLMPGCDLPVQAMPEGTNDPLFHVLGDKSVPRDPARAKAAVAGRVGGDPANLTLAYRDQLQALDHILATCGRSTEPASPRTSLFDIPSTLALGTGDHLVDLKGPINTASTLVENLLLEYTNGMDKENVGWGCVGHNELQSLITLHTAATDFAQKTPEVARAQASGLLNRIGLSMDQAISHQAKTGAIGKPGDLALFLVGHDTNQENVAGVLGLTWIIDGRRDDTPPGGSLVFEVRHSRSGNTYSVTTYFTAQTLDQMRDSTPLSGSHAPARVPVFIPGCSRDDMSCDYRTFVGLLEH